MSAFDFVFVIKSLNPGGAERVLVNLAAHFYKKGFSVAILTFEKKGEMAQSLPANVPVFCIGQGIKGLLALASFFNHNEIKRVISFLFYSNARAAFVKFFFRWKGRLILTEHSSPLRYAGGLRLANISRKLVGRLLFGFANKYFVVSPELVSDVCKVFRVDENVIEVVPNPFDAEVIRQCGQVEITGKAKLFYDKYKVICAVGRLVPEKGFDVLIKSFAVLPDEYCLVLLGDGCEFNKLKKIARSSGILNRVVFIGFDANPWKYISNSIFVVVPSIQEGFGNVIVESSILSIPVLSTDCVGPRFIFSKSNFDDFVDPGSVDSMSKALSKYACSPFNLPIADYDNYLVEKVSEKYVI